RESRHWTAGSCLPVTRFRGFEGSRSMLNQFLFRGRRLLAAALFVIFSGSTRFSQTASFCSCIDQSSVEDLPVVELRAARDEGWLAILVSGDGGWRAIDREIAEGLNRRGISVVGLVAPEYFAVRRTPDESACALRKLITHYSLEWHAPHVILCGYSRGAGVLPFMFNRLPDRLKPRVELSALIGLDRTIDFEVTPVDLFRDTPSSREVPVRSEVERMRGKRVLCIYGRRDRNSLCPALDPLLATRIGMTGGHHLCGAYDRLARIIWSAALSHGHAAT